MSDEVIRSQLPNENYRKGWDETFGKRVEEDQPFVSHCKHGSFSAGCGCHVCAHPELDESDFAPRDKEERGND